MDCRACDCESRRVSAFCPVRRRFGPREETLHRDRYVVGIVDPHGVAGLRHQLQRRVWQFLSESTRHLGRAERVVLTPEEVDRRAYACKERVGEDDIAVQTLHVMFHRPISSSLRIVSVSRNSEV